MYCGLSTASEVFLISTTQLYQYFGVSFLFALFSDEPEVFFSKYMYSQKAILHAAHFRRVVHTHLGSSTYNDVPVEALVPKFCRVILVDVVVPRREDQVTELVRGRGRGEQARAEPCRRPEI